MSVKNLSARLVILALFGVSANAAVPQVINYQGFLTNTSGAALDTVANVTFRIFNLPTGGAAVWSETQSVNSTGGLFTVLLGINTPIDEAIIDGDAKYLEVLLGAAPFSPRSRLAAAPYAIRIATIDGASGGIITGDVNVTGKATIGPGNTNIGVNAFVAGESNSASGYGSAVGGGYDNTASGDLATVGGGETNIATNFHATIAGGQGNTASGLLATVGGGYYNTASPEYGTIAGGYYNFSGGIAATVGGGAFDTASGLYSMVPGGYSSKAAGENSFAAGYRAKALHTGSFVWADASINADFESTFQNQFLIRANTVGIGTNSPSAKLHVDGTFKVGLDGTAMSNIQHGYIGTGSAASAGSSGNVVFPAAYAQVPKVFLQVEDLDANGATSVRINSISTTGFSWQAFVGNTLTAADRISWLAFGQ